ncbi:hypothetical protein HPP92_006589 [Vanilla planifolia]|uniref:DUF4220 domain-containing protein n=1 Tax=Vanilla planifolia TaxID=51239 RepID=A0A835RCD8_VANPL|nr:hypothetical protein HPP92_006589 [Vanilla planifolia]
MDIPGKYKKLWSKWDVRILIMVSLAIQIVLIFLGRLRKTSASTALIRMAVWSNYLLANWVVDFVLGQLSGSMDHNSKNALLAFWVPFLCFTMVARHHHRLFHGGQ